MPTVCKTRWVHLREPTLFCRGGRAPRVLSIRSADALRRDRADEAARLALASKGRPRISVQLIAHSEGAAVAVITSYLGIGAWQLDRSRPGLGSLAADRPEGGVATWLT